MKTYLLTILLLAFNLCAFGQDDKDTVIVNKKTMFFYSPNCSEIRDVPKSDTIKFYTAEFAEIYGFIRAKQCNGVILSTPVATQQTDSNTPPAVTQKQTDSNAPVTEEQIDLFAFVEERVNSLGSVTQQNGIFFADKKSKIYYILGCAEISEIPFSDVVTFRSSRVAEDKGFIKTKVCTYDDTIVGTSSRTYFESVGAIGNGRYYSGGGSNSGGTVRVRSYTRGDGTRVRQHTRRAPRRR